MPGRQAHGRSLTAQPKSKNRGKSSKARSQKNALNAFGIAQEMYPTREKKTPRFRELEVEVERKHERGDADEDEDEDEDEDQPPRKRSKKPVRPADDDAEYGSDSEGNEWRLGGMAEDDEDSEIDSDDAFGDSDEGKFDNYKFGGSKSKNEESDSEDDSNDDEGETLGEEAIDLATALDQWEESEDEPAAKAGSESSADDSGSEGSDESEETDDSDGDDDDDDDDSEADPEKLEALRGLVSGFGGDEDKNGNKASAKQKIDFGDLGLSGIDDPFIKNSVKLMSKEQKEKRPGSTKKLDIPLSRREQGRMDRSAAYEKTNETLDRWTETVKQNRRADHLVFPLKPTSGTAGLDTTEIQPLTATNTSNELESAILSIMDQSGLSMEKPKKEKPKVYDEDGNELSQRQVLNLKRQEREQNAREAKRAARIKKIKSKAYHRVHRKQKERDEMKIQEAMEEAGEIDSEAEREAQDRRRALERVGQRHRESKWAKMGNKVKRAVWDDDFRSGLTEMARKDDELRRRKEGKAGDSDDETSSSGSDSEDGGDAALLREIDEIQAEDEEPKKGLMGLKFMQKAEAGRRAELKKLRDSIAAGGEEDLSEEETGEVGRRKYGGVPTMSLPGPTPAKKTAKDDGAKVPSVSANNNTLAKSTRPSDSWSEDAPAEDVWSSAPSSKRSKKAAAASSTTLGNFRNDKTFTVAAPKPRSTTTTTRQTDQDDQDEDDVDQHMPLAIRDQELVDRAFADDDVMAAFEAEKADIAEEDDDKEIDNTLPGWGSWVGDGVSAREQKRHKGRFVTKVEGIKKNDRKDAKLDKVIINEKRIKKNDRYLATQLPHPFESREQYERSLRLPMGPEWQTKETFQDSTKPRVLMKRGVIAPISKPTA